MSNSWKTVKLGDIADVTSGNSAPQDKSLFINGKYPFIRMSDVGGIHIGKIKSSRDLLNDKGIQNLRLFPKGSILFPKSGASTYLNHRVILGIEAYVANHLAVIFNTSEKIDKKYLFYYLLTIDTQGLIHDAQYPSLRLSVIEDLQVPLPPLPEQQRIVALLDQVFEKIDNLEKISIHRLFIDLLDSYIDELLNKYTNNWSTSSLEKITTKIGSGATPLGGRKVYKEEGISFIRSMNVYDKGFHAKGLVFIGNNHAKELVNVEVKEHDVLLNITGASILRCCVVPSEVLPARVNQHVSIIRANKSIIDPEFLHYYLVSPKIKSDLLRIAKTSGSTREALTKEIIENYEISFPSNIGDQKEIVANISKIKKLLEDCSINFMKRKEKIDNLKKSLLANAFLGKI